MVLSGPRILLFLGVFLATLALGTLVARYFMGWSPGISVLAGLAFAPVGAYVVWGTGFADWFDPRSELELPLPHDDPRNPPWWQHRDE